MPAIFHQDHGWAVLVGFIRTESWVDLVDYVFEVLRRWTTDTMLFKENFRLHVLEQELICGNIHHMAFRWFV